MSFNILFQQLYKYFRWWAITVPINAPFSCLWYLHQPYTDLKAITAHILPRDKFTTVPIHFLAVKGHAG